MEVLLWFKLSIAPSAMNTFLSSLPNIMKISLTQYFTFLIDGN